MKINILLFAISTLLTVNCFSQTPEYLWAKRAGVFGATAYNMAVDASGNVVVTGFFSGPNILFGTTNLTNSGSGSDIFVVKYDPTGNVLWAKKQTGGGSNEEVAWGVAIDAIGNIIVTGRFNSPSITFGTTTLTNAGANDIFIVKYSPNGNVLWAKQQDAGGQNNEVPYQLAVDPNGNILITGNFQSPTITFGATTLTNTTPSPAADVFIVKYNPNGNVLWAKKQEAGGSANEFCGGIAADAGGNVIVSGWFNSPTITFGTTTLTNAQSPNSIDIFIVKYDPSGNVLWAKQQDGGGTGDDNASSVTADGTGNVIVSGWFNSPTITFGTTTLTSSGGRDLFIVKYDPNGNVLWTKKQTAGGTNDDVANCVARDANGNLLLTGYFKSSSITFGTNTLTNAGSNSNDVFIVKFDPNGNALWAKQQTAGGSLSDVANSITADGSGNVFLTGTYTATLNPLVNITFGTTTLGMPSGNPSPSAVSIFVVKLKDTPQIVTFQQSVVLCRGKSIQVADTSYSTAGTFIRKTKTLRGNLDSIITTTVTITNPDLVILDSTKCRGQSARIGNRTFANTGLYKDTLTNRFGCDSIINLFLVILEPKTGFRSFTVCAGDTVLDAGRKFSDEGSFETKLTTKSTGCDSIHTTEVKHIKLKLETFPDSIASIDYGQTLDIQALAAGDNLRYEWRPAEMVDCDSCAQTQTKPIIRSTKFTAFLTDTKFNCTAEKSFNIKVNCTLTVPNLVTLNGDNANDFLYLKRLECISDISSFKVYNRWGKELETSIDLSASQGITLWKPEAAGIYFYALKVNMIDREPQEFQGWIQVVK